MSAAPTRCAFLSMRRFKPALIACALVPAFACAQVYRWVDETGKTHYGEKPPAKNTQAIPLKDEPSGPAPIPRKSAEKGASASKGGTAREEREFQKRREARLRQEEQEKRAQATQERQEATDARKKRGECTIASRELTNMRNNPTNYTFDQEKRVKERVARNCG